MKLTQEHKKVIVNTMRNWPKTLDSESLLKVLEKFALDLLEANYNEMVNK